MVMDAALGAVQIRIVVQGGLHACDPLREVRCGLRVCAQQAGHPVQFRFQRNGRRTAQDKAEDEEARQPAKPTEEDLFILVWRIHDGRKDEAGRVGCT